MNSTHIEIQTKPHSNLSLSWSNINVYARNSHRFNFKFNAPHKSYEFKENDDTSEVTLCSTESRLKAFYGCLNKNKQMKQILRNIHGSIKSGESLAILGSSGCGKSTLLNALTNRLSDKFEMSGDVRINGKQFDTSEYRKRVGYVYQDDIFIGTLTVKEHLTFLAIMMMSNETTNRDKLSKVDQVLRDFNLLKCKDNLIGYVDSEKGISGGEKRRLAFASEILIDPDILFCDEPTSGLDSHMALVIVNTIQKLTLSGMAIVCVIHQPSSQIHEKFDKICFLAEGKVVFFGKRTEAHDFFSKIGFTCPLQYNPADYFIELLADLNNIHLICNKYQLNLIDETNDAKTMDVSFKINDYKVYKASYFKQFIWLFWRQFRSLLREPIASRLQFIQSIAIGLFLGFTYFQIKDGQSSIQDKNGLVFMILMQAVISYIFGVANHYHSQWHVTNREVKNGTYSILVYFLAKILSEIPQTILSSLLMVTIVYWIANIQPNVEVFLKIASLIVLTANASVAYGTFLAIACPNLDTSIGLIGPTIVPLLIFSGFLINNNNIPVYFIWIKYISWIYYANESIMIILWSSIESIACPIIQTNFTSSVMPCLKHGNDVLEQFAIEKNNLNRNISILAAQIILWFGLASIILLIKSRK